jgi:hypothetical protein
MNFKFRTPPYPLQSIPRSNCRCGYIRTWIVIQRRWPDSTIQAIAHTSCSLTPAEQNYSQIEKEGLALIFAVKKFRKYIHDRHFTLLTDHRPLLLIFGSRKGIQIHSENRLQRWAAALLGYDFKIEHRKSTDFGQADALSHLISHAAPDEEVVAALQADFDIQSLTSHLPVTFDKLRTVSQKDKLLQTVKQYIKASRISKLSTSTQTGLSLKVSTDDESPS